MLTLDQGHDSELHALGGTCVHTFRVHVGRRDRPIGRGARSSSRGHAWGGSQLPVLEFPSHPQVFGVLASVAAPLNSWRVGGQNGRHRLRGRHVQHEVHRTIISEQQNNNT